MRARLLFLLVMPLVLLGPVSPYDAAQAAKAKPDLAVPSVAASLSGGQVSVTVKVKNRGSRKAGASTTSLVLSRDTTASSDDLPLGSLATPKAKPRGKVTVGGLLAAPTRISGGYYVVACADSGGVVKERRESDNCTTTAAPVSFGDLATRVDGAAGPGGRVTAAGVAGGSCATVGTGQQCALAPATGAVTFVATPDAGYRFDSWSGPTCTGATVAGTQVSFSGPATDRACVASFVRVVTVSWRTVGRDGGIIQVFGMTAATCSPLKGTSGTCTVDAGVGSVRLGAGAARFEALFQAWENCQSTTASTITVTPTTDQQCDARIVTNPNP